MERIKLLAALVMMLASSGDPGAGLIQKLCAPTAVVRVAREN